MRAGQPFYKKSITTTTMMITLQKYLLREWLMAFIGVSIILLLVVVGAFANDMLNSVADGSLPPALLGSQLLLRVPEAGQLIFPLALFIAVMLGLGRLYRDQEMAVMRACGFHWHKMLLPLAALVLPIAILLLIMTFWIAPRASLVAGEQLEQAYQSAVVWGLKPGQFHSMQQGQFVVYVESMAEQGGQFEKVFIFQKTACRSRSGIRNGAIIGLILIQAIVIYVCLTGRSPTAAKMHSTITLQHLNGPI